MSYNLEFHNSARFVASSFFNLISNLPEGIHHDQKCENCRIKYKYCECFLEYTNFEYN